ncbi:hypothetical protein [Clostridium scatologenes]|uniref:Uncharacterized protein n=1 Tax=Clostridium scatologenes TaxID=1548 RepID=A0A0E3K2U9_CLOSL|nr:hypothetical protein [Clostridium scatologenes]AKA71145.1 hypothetical protein CSCA_4020 [Clostridium scatologenes]
MRDKVIFVDFTKNKNKKQSMLSMLKSFFRKIFNSANTPSNPSDPSDTKKVIHYNRDIS